MACVGFHIKQTSPFGDAPKSVAHHSCIRSWVGCSCGFALFVDCTICKRSPKNPYAIVALVDQYAMLHAYQLQLTATTMKKLYIHATAMFRLKPLEQASVTVSLIPHPFLQPHRAYETSAVQLNFGVVL